MTSKASHQHLAALRLYFPTATKAKATRFWHHLSAPALAQHLLKVAKEAKLTQAMLHQVSSGYLPGERMSHHHPELADMRHPQCLELLDTEHRLRDFMHEHADELRKVHAVLFLCELPLGQQRATHAVRHVQARNDAEGHAAIASPGAPRRGYQLTFFTEDEAALKRLMAALDEEDVNLAYVKAPVEYGRTGKAAR